MLTVVNLFIHNAEKILFKLTQSWMICKLIYPVPPCCPWFGPHITAWTHLIMHSKMWHSASGWSMSSLKFPITSQININRYQQSIHCWESWPVRTHIYSKAATSAKSPSERYPTTLYWSCISSCPHWLRLCQSHLSNRTDNHGKPYDPLVVHTRPGCALQGPGSLIQSQHTFSFTFTCFRSELKLNSSGDALLFKSQPPQTFPLA